MYLISAAIFLSVRYRSMSLSSILSKNKKIEYYIIIKAHKPIVLKLVLS